MREIKFRAKDEDTGEWIYGGIVHQTDFYGDTCDKWFIITGNETNDYDIGYPYLVEEKSIGQYTGLKDKNGKEIYEGDVLQVKGIVDLLYIVKFYNGHFFGISQYDEHYESPLTIENTLFHGIEVIGNIYENPDLLEKYNEI